MADIHELIRPSYIRLGSGHTLHETLGIAVASIEREGTFPPMVVLDEEGDVSGIVSPIALLRGLCMEGMPLGSNPGPSADTMELLERAHNRLQASVDEATIKDPPLLRESESIVEATRKIVRARLDFLPVAEGRRATGVVHAADIFRKLASIALDEPVDSDRTGAVFL